MAAILPKAPCHHMVLSSWQRSCITFLSRPGLCSLLKYPTYMKSAAMEVKDLHYSNTNPHSRFLHLKWNVERSTPVYTGRSVRVWQIFSK